MSATGTAVRTGDASVEGAEAPPAEDVAPAGVIRRRARETQSVGRHRTLVASTAALGLGLLGVLLINTVVSQGAFRQHQLEVDLILASEQEEALTRAVQLAESPLQVEKAARALGMVPAASPVFLRLADGSILGSPVAATAQYGKVDYSGAPGLPVSNPDPADPMDTSAAGQTPPADGPTGDPMADPILPVPPSSPPTGANPDQPAATPGTAAPTTVSTAVAGQTEPATAANGTPATGPAAGTGVTTPAAPAAPTAGTTTP